MFPNKNNSANILATLIRLPCFNKLDLRYVSFAYISGGRPYLHFCKALKSFCSPAPPRVLNWASRQL